VALRCRLLRIGPYRHHRARAWYVLALRTAVHSCSHTDHALYWAANPAAKKCRLERFEGRYRS